MRTSKILEYAYVFTTAIVTTRASPSLDPIAHRKRSEILSASVYIFSSSPSATAALSKALETLGYIHFDPQSASQVSQPIYVELPVDVDYVEIATSNPEARFLLPKELTSTEPMYWSWLGMNPHDKGAPDELRGKKQTIQGFFSLGQRSHQFLEIEIYPELREAERAQNWVKLCDFLGLGYSIVEKLGLYWFPLM
ncbi:hypothetical protein GGR58DRAFT_526099 [Xylaria digitata]|nr:hypothetical protein GGR58DRAFT_526099 [Xylaria digitata]